MTPRQVLIDRMIVWSPVMLLGALAAMAYWLNAQIQSAAPAFDGSGRHDPDLYISNLKAVSLDTEGRIGQALTARTTRHFPDDDTTEFDAPEIVFSDPGKPKLSVTGDHAVVTGDREHAYFSGHVKGVREATGEDARDGPVSLTSEYLHVIPKQDRVLTDKPVTIQDPRGIIHATGMEFDNRSKKLKFGSHVSGQLQPRK